MSETAGALGYKADVKTRAKDAVVEKKDALVSKVTGAMPDPQGVKDGAQSVKHGARRGVRIADTLFAVSSTHVQSVVLERPGEVLGAAEL